MTLGNLNVFHFGIVVEDIHASMTELGERFDLTWAPLVEAPIDVRTAEGERVTEHLKFTYSSQGPPNIELVESRERRLWTPTPDGMIHHVGAYDDDFAGAVARNTATGASLEFGGGHAEQPVGYAYFRVPGGMRVELIDGARRANFEAWFAGGEF